ncbi:transcriptional regulator [Prauserella marina]|uniref:DNA-binding transcriptional regulator, AcrR family n=1 Tax=Prauserella marina TaxID=530584 RepID=A0A222VQU7_9PSEU|nr:TetR/AcrR family transcriptional regulator [Prauserella marina]ASR36101.1 transcriptional regulator [Prauserella marina]PWV76833.1 TetR family transcriptional regulator [Prauserella marina]SDC98622.1 DNA-binding transcriptional regulator, AcrR family [Prauserella marina]
MARPSAREQILDAYQDVLLDSGPGGVTLDAVAARAEVSKGGLLYHFGSKDALLDGLLDRLDRLSATDIEAARVAPEGLVRYYLTTSVTDASMDNPAHKASVAALRMLGSEQRVAKAMADVTRKWEQALRDEVDDPLTAEILALIGDGLYLRATMGERAAPLLDDPAALFRRIGLAENT